MRGMQNWGCTGYGLTIAWTCALLVAGCGDGDGRGLVPVKGRVTVKGQPLDGAVVTFLAPPWQRGNLGARGVSDGTGAFAVIGSRLGKSGALPGDYRVTLSRMVDAEGKPLALSGGNPDSPGTYESIPAAFASAEKTTLTATVPPKGGPVEIDLPVDLVKKKN